MLDTSRVWRAIVWPRFRSDPNLIIYIDASAERYARMKIAYVIAGLEGDEPGDIEHRIREVKHAQTCIDEGRHPEPELRIFEVGCGADGVTIAAQPLFLVANPGEFCLAWVRARTWAA